MDLLPGLWAGLLGALLAAALRRWLDPVPWRVLAVFAAVLLILFGPVLFGGKLLLPLDGLRGATPFQRLAPTRPHGNFLQGDLIQLVTPSLAVVRAAWAEGRWPLWNARVGAGMPLLADPQAQAFQPLVFLATPLPLARAAGVTAALRVLVALVFSFLWMRRQGLGEPAALAGSLAYGLGGFLLLWVGWPIANPAALLPLVLYAVARCDEPGRRRDGLLLAVAALALLVGGHPETIAYVLIVSLLFLLDRVRRRPRGLRWALFRRAGTALLVAVAVAAPAWLPFLEYLPKTMRWAALTSPNTFPSPGEGGREGSGEGLGVRALSLRWLPLVAPNAYGNSRYAYYWGLSNTNEDASGFVGTATLLAALLVIGRRRFPQETLALGIAALCLLLLAVPLGSRRLLLPFSFCTAYLGACGLERFRLGEIRRRSLLIAALGLGAVLVWGYLTHPAPGDPRLLEVFRRGWLSWQLRFLALAVLLLLVAVSWQRRGRSLAVTGVATAIAAELLLLHLPANPPMPRRLAFPVPDALGFLWGATGGNVRAGPGFRVAALGPALPPNLASLYDLTDARVYNPMAPQAYVERTAPITVGWRGEIPLWGNPNHRLYGRLAVLFLLTDPGTLLPPPFERLYAGVDGAVWKLRDAQPRLFLQAPKGGRRSVYVPRLEESWISTEARLNRPQRLASSIYQDGGWLAVAGGRRLPVSVDQGVFLAVHLPPGYWRIDLLYRPRGFLWGLALAALGLVGGVAVFVPRPGRLSGVAFQGS
jgi:hypothetical protein